MAGFEDDDYDGEGEQDEDEPSGLGLADAPDPLACSLTSMEWLPRIMVGTG